MSEQRKIDSRTWPAFNRWLSRNGRKSATAGNTQSTAGIQTQKRTPQQKLQASKAKQARLARDDQPPQPTVQPLEIPGHVENHLGPCPKASQGPLLVPDPPDGKRYPTGFDPKEAQQRNEAAMKTGSTRKPRVATTGRVQPMLAPGMEGE